MTWQPYWLPATAYSVTAVVIPTTFAGFTWRCTVAGTSGGTDPFIGVNPSITPTVTDGGVTWSVGTGFRQAVQAGLADIAGIVATFSAANPTIVRQVVTVRRLSFSEGELPVFILGDLNEADSYSSGVRQRIFTATAYLVDRLGEPLESNDRMNFAADALLDLFTLNYHAASPYSILECSGIRDTEFDETVKYPALEFTFSAYVAEGRT